MVSGIPSRRISSFLNITDNFNDVFYFCRIPTEKVERSPLKPLQSPNCSGPAITIQSPVNHRLNHATSEAHLLSNGKEQSPGQMKGIVHGRDCTVVNVTGENDKIEEGKIPVVYGSKASCQWNEATIEDGRIHKESKGEQKDEEMRKERGVGEPKDEENIEQKLYKIANELLQTERAYVARLHLLDQVSVVIYLWLPPRKCNALDATTKKLGLI